MVAPPAAAGSGDPASKRSRGLRIRLRPSQRRSAAPAPLRRVKAVCDAASETTLQCLVCHETVTPGVFHDWTESRHAKRTVAEELAEPELSRRFGRLSATEVPDALRAESVGCAECHTLNPEKHADTFDHNGFRIHTVVTPDDCAVCHPVEREEYARNLMSRAQTNLAANPVYHSLADAANGPQRLDGDQLVQDRPSTTTEADSCFACHGTKVGVEGTRSRSTELGEMEFPVLTAVSYTHLTLPTIYSV